MKHLTPALLVATAGLSLLSTTANAQSYSATQVFGADSTVTSGTLGLGGQCISNCFTQSTDYTPLGLSDNDVAYATQNVQSSSRYGSSYSNSLVVWDKGPQVSSGYLLYPASQSIYAAASNAGAIPTFAGGSYVAPVSGTMSFLTGVSNSGRLLAASYDPTITTGLNQPNQQLVSNRSAGNDLYVSAVGGSGWSKVSHNASTSTLVSSDLTNDGKVVGYAVDTSGHTQAFYTTGNGGTLQLINTSGISDSAFGSINDLGVAAGVMVMSLDSSSHIFTYDTQSGILTDLGLDPGGGLALKINDAGQIVRGSSVYDPLHGQWVQPTVAGLSGTWTFSDINNRGDILAKSTSGVYILQAVPEPATLLLTGLGLFGIGFVSRQKKRHANSAC